MIGSTIILYCICLSQHVLKNYFPVRRAVSLIYIFDFVCFSSGRKCFGENLACSNQIWQLKIHENLSLNRGFNGKINCKWWMDLHVSFKKSPFKRCSWDVSLCCLGSRFSKKKSFETCSSGWASEIPITS